jgi:hypothetical protein
MKLKVEIQLDGAAFTDEGGLLEVQRILHELVDRLSSPLEATNEGINLRDYNGNLCGKARVTR